MSLSIKSAAIYSEYLYITSISHSTSLKFAKKTMKEPKHEMIGMLEKDVLLQHLVKWTVLWT